MVVSKVFLIIWICLGLTVAEQVEYGQRSTWLPRAFAKPFNVDTELDCAVKELAWEYAKKLLPQHGNNQAAYDALQLKSCNVSLDSGKKYATGPPKYKAAAANENWLTAADIIVYVDSVEGSDNNPGTTSQPVKTIAAAVRIFRFKKKSINDQGLISLRAGTYYLDETINLTAEDSNLVILGDGHENTFVSGGKNYTFDWKTYIKRMGALEMDTDLMNGVLEKAETSNSRERFAGKTTNAQDCQTVCKKDATCFAFTWYDDSFGDFSNTCYFRAGGLRTPTYVKGAMSGRKVNILVADLSGQNPTPFTTLFLNGRRAVRARYPDGNPETMGLYTNPTGYVQSAPKWLPLANTPSPLLVNVENPQRMGTYYPQFILHIDGPDAIFDPPKSFFIHRVTTGLQYSPNEGFATRSWRNASTGVVHAFHCKHWGNWMFAIDNRNQTTHEISWSYGGFQEAGAGCAQGAEWFVDNIFEELDDPGEWFYDEAEQKLYLYPNGTDLPSSGVGTKLQRLFDIHGSISHPVYNITLMNITFQHTEPTYFESYESPNGGAFSVHRGGAVLAEGVDGFTVQQCLFDSPFNSWDRQPYITKVKDGSTPSLDQATNIITRNFIINNYHSNGSCYYNDTFNYLVYGGYKHFKRMPCQMCMSTRMQFHLLR